MARVYDLYAEKGSHLFRAEWVNSACGQFGNPALQANAGVRGAQNSANLHVFCADAALVAHHRAGLTGTADFRIIKERRLECSLERSVA